RNEELFSSGWGVDSSQQSGGETANVPRGMPVQDNRPEVVHATGIIGARQRNNSAHALVAGNSADSDRAQAIGIARRFGHTYRVREEARRCSPSGDLHATG